MSFLNPLSNTRPKAKVQKESQDSCPYSRRESVEDDKSEKLIKILTTRMNKKEEKYPDYNFFMSLLDDFSAINSELKMDAKMEIMGVIKKYVQMSKYSGQKSNYGSPGYFTSMDSSSNSTHTLTLATSHNLNTSSPAHSHLSDSTQESIYDNLFNDDYGDN